MVTGPQQQRLEKALAGASDEAVNNGSTEWLRCAELLGNVAEALRKAAAAEKTIGGQTGPAMAKAFRTSAEGMEGKSQELMRGSEALGVASTAIMAARVGQSDMNRYFPQAPDPGPYRPQPGPQDDADVTAASDHQALVDAYTGSYESRENIARQWADRIDKDFAESTKTMQEIHGEKFQEPGGDDGPGGHTPPSTSPPPGTGRPPRGNPVVEPRDPHPPRPPQFPEPPVCTIQPPPLPPQPPTEVTPVHPTPLPPVPPTPISDVPTGTPTPVLEPTGVSTGSPPGLVGPAIGAIAGGGLAGAALQGIRGGLFSGGSAGATPGRPIGSTGRAGAPGALGRGGAASPGSAAGRGTGAGARSAGGGAGRGTGGRGAAGGRGAGAGGGAGGRRGGKAAAGAAAAAGRKGGKDKDQRGEDRDLFDDGQDWIDDADAAPGVID